MVTSVLVTNNNIMIVTAHEPIIQHSKLAHRLKFYLQERYMDDLDTKAATVMLEILAPNGKRKSVPLTCEDSSGKAGYLLYQFDLESEYLTASGDINLGMSITYADMSLPKAIVRTIDGTVLPVTPVQEWTVQATDESLTEIQNQIVQLTKIATAIYEAEGQGGGSSAYDLEVSDKNLHLVNAVGKKIGDGLAVSDDSIDMMDEKSDGELDLSKILAMNNPDPDDTGEGGSNG